VTWTREQTVTLPASGLAEVRLPLSASGAPKFYRATSLGGTTQPPAPATLALALAAPDQLRITVTGTPGATYAVESTDSYATWTKQAEAVIPAAATSVTVTVAIPAGTPFLAFRATGIGTTPEPPVRPQPTLAIEVPTLSGTTLKSALQLTGGETNSVYTVEQSTNLRTWNNAPQTIQTDAQGRGRLAIDVVPEVSVFYRTSIR
jgi:hypothetical protein